MKRTARKSQNLKELYSVKTYHFDVWSSLKGQLYNSILEIITIGEWFGDKKSVC